MVVVTVLGFTGDMVAAVEGRRTHALGSAQGAQGAVTAGEADEAATREAARQKKKVDEEAQIRAPLLF